MTAATDWVVINDDVTQQEDGGGDEADKDAEGGEDGGRLVGNGRCAGVGGLDVAGEVEDEVGEGDAGRDAQLLQKDKKVTNELRRKKQGIGQSRL